MMRTMMSYHSWRLHRHHAPFERTIFASIAISTPFSSSSSSSKPPRSPVLLRKAFRLHKSPLATSSPEMSLTAKQTSRYGSWKSPLTADLVSGAAKRLEGLAVDGEGRAVWLEGRPTEAGRGVLVRESEHAGSTPTDITPVEFYVRTLVHEYGGGAFTVDEERIIFSNYKDQRLYLQHIKGNAPPIPLTPEYGEPIVRYADGVVDRRHNCYIVVREDHRQKGKEPVNEIVAVHLKEHEIKEPEVLLSGKDFYAFPRVSPDGSKLAWIEWSHPNMPWDRSQLWVGDISFNGKITRHHCIAGGDEAIVEAPTEPLWSSKGELFFISDRDNGFWNLYHWIEGEKMVEALYSLNAEFGRPAWVFGNSSYQLIEDNERENLLSIVCTYRHRGRSHLGILFPHSKSLRQLEIPFTDITDLFTSGDYVFLRGASATHAPSIIKVNLKKMAGLVPEYSIIWSSSSLDMSIYMPYLSIPEIIEFPTKVAGVTAYANFYPPSNMDFQPQEGEKPPLLVRSHGGPTGEARTSLDLGIQYWTSRGWAFADVNYGGSTGYGREYRERLYGKWGIVDVDDCCSCAEFLVAAGKVDGQQLCVDGRSAGGYTTLAALVFRDTFKAGASLYGIGDLSVLVADTHKFESHYIHSLIGDDTRVIFERSPINFLENLSCPIILFQGLEDKVVPPNQAKHIFEAVKQRGIPVALVEYEGEQHGFRKAENVRYTLEQEMAFFARLVGHFKVADDIKPVQVDNLD